VPSSPPWTAAASVPPILVLGDNQPGNVMSAPGSGPVLNDFERVAVGPAAVDLAALVLGLQHFGYPPAVAQEFLDGYGPGAPTLEQARPYARIRELSGAAIAMIQAGDSPEMEREMRVRAVAVTSPGAGQQWTFVGNPAAMTVAGVPGPQVTTVAAPGAARPGRRGRDRPDPGHPR
jgi:Phosphotransferase enzyme family